MGLDVSLYKCPNPKKAHKLELVYDEALTKLYASFGDFEKKNEATNADEELLNEERAKLAQKYEMNGYRHKSVQTIHFDSKSHPDHLFKIGYLRSSYNETGINNILATFGMPTLYDIFQVSDDEYYQYVDWEDARARCVEVIDEFKAHMASPMGKYTIETFRPLVKHGVATKEEALERFNQELLKHQEAVKAHEEICKLDEKRKAYPPYGDYRSRDGNFYLDNPLKVYGVIDHTAKPDQKGWLAQLAATYLIVEADPANKQWYLTALEITLEMIDHVLADPHPEHFYLGWSG